MAQYLAYIPSSQFGCARGRGTAQASLSSLAFWESCRVLERSSAILFLDLSKAFDLCIRELLFGFPDDFGEDKMAYFARLGDQAPQVGAEVVRTGGILRECGADSATRQAMESLHTGSWFIIGREGDLYSKPTLVTKRGGRQGCRLGALVFNWIYARCLRELRRSMESENVVFHLAESGEAPF